MAAAPGRWPRARERRGYFAATRSIGWQECLRRPEPATLLRGAVFHSCTAPWVPDEDGRKQGNEQAGCSGVRVQNGQGWCKPGICARGECPRSQRICV